MRRFLTAIASAIVVVAAATLAAPAASAGPSYLDATTTDVYPGGSVTFTTNYTYGADFINGEYDGSGSWGGGFTVDWDDLMNCDAPTVLTTWTAYASPPGFPPTIEGADAYVNVTFHACNKGTPPAPVLQQVPVPSTGMCSDVIDTDLNWGGSASGGWSKSWADWINPGIGGWVCTRTLTYSDAVGHWVSG